MHGADQMHNVRLRHQAHLQMGTGWLGIPGHMVGVREVRGSNSGEPFLCSASNFAEDTLGEKRNSVRDITQHATTDFTMH